MSWDTQILDRQDRIAELLNADPYINDPTAGKKIGVVTWRVGDIGKAVAAAVVKRGIVLVVMLPSGTCDDSEVPAIPLTNRFVVMIKENPLRNRGTTGTGKPAEVLLLHVMKAVHWKPVTAANRTSAKTALFRLDRLAYQILRPAPRSPDRQADAPLNYAVNINTQITI